MTPTQIIRNGYHIIRNEGEVPWQLFSLLGGSLTRGSENTIGEFGSGTKYSIELLLRHNIYPIIYSGLKKIEFFTDKQTISDAVSSKDFDVINIKVTEPDTGPSFGDPTRKIPIDRVTIKPTALSLQHGIQEWNDVTMAAREFIANALDMQMRLRSNRDITIDKISSLDEFAPEPGYTVVLLPMQPDLNEYFRHIDSYFLHFSEDHDENVEIFSNRFDSNKTFIFRQGVRSATLNMPSIFCYNSKNFKLTESRVVSESEAQSEVNKLFFRCTSKEIWCRLLMHLNESVIEKNERLSITKNSFESTMYPVRIDMMLTKVKDAVREAFIDTFGTDAVLCNNRHSVELAVKNNLKPIIVPDNWYSYLKPLCPNIGDKADYSDIHYKNIRPCSTETREYFDKAWKCFNNLGYLAGKSKPKVQIYDKDNNILDGKYDSKINCICLPDQLDGVSAVTKGEIIKCLISMHKIKESDHSFMYDKLVVQLMETSVMCD